MEYIIKQNKSDLNSCDTRANSPALFGPVSPRTLQAKLELGGDFKKLTIVR